MVSGICVSFFIKNSDQSFLRSVGITKTQISADSCISKKKGSARTDWASFNTHAGIFEGPKDLLTFKHFFKSWTSFQVTYLKTDRFAFPVSAENVLSNILLSPKYSHKTENLNFKRFAMSFPFVISSPKLLCMVSITISCFSLFQTSCINVQ